MKKQPKKRATSKKSAALFAFPRLKISHHKHSGKLLSHRHTSYPTLAMIVLVVGVLMGGVTSAAIAGDMLVTASLLGPAPTTAATIDTPAEGARFTTKPITVSGSCPDDTYVTLLRNGVASGVAICSAQGTYSLQVDLFVGANELQAQVYNTTNVAGPPSGTITVFYEAPVTVAPPTAPKSPTTTTPQPQSSATQQPSSTSSAQPLLLETKFRFGGSYVGQPASFDFTISGGQGPYSIMVDWGDGTQKNITIAADGSFTLEHIYQQAGPNQGTFPVKVTATDSTGATAFIEIIALIRDTVPAAGATNETDPGAGTTAEGGGILKYVWSIYAVVLLMVVSFWLGELREYQHLKPRFNNTRHV